MNGQSGTAGCANIAPPLSNTEASLGNAFDALRALDECAEHLSQRLIPVINPAPLPDAVKYQEDERLVSPLVQGIEKLSAGMNEIRCKLDTITNQLDL